MPRGYLGLLAFSVALTFGIAFRLRLGFEGPAGLCSDRSANLGAEFVTVLGSNDEFAEEA